MNRQKPILKGLSDSRFSTMIFLLRVAGIPFKMKKISTLYFIYMVTVSLCTATTYLGIFVDEFVNKDDLGRAMTSMRAFIASTNAIWIFLNCQ